MSKSSLFIKVSLVYIGTIVSAIFFPNNMIGSFILLWIIIFFGYLIFDSIILIKILTDDNDLSTTVRSLLLHGLKFAEEKFEYWNYMKHEYIPYLLWLPLLMILVWSNSLITACVVGSYVSINTIVISLLRKFVNLNNEFFLLNADRFKNDHQ